MSPQCKHSFAGVSVTEQPQPSALIYPVDEKAILEDGHSAIQHDHSCGCDQQSSHSEHRHCHNGRLRRFLLPALAAFMLLAGLFAFRCMGGYDLSSLGMSDLVSRAVSDSSNTGNPLVNRKLYLIIIFVGLFVVVILAVMLSAWCCKGAFQNPLCCPCYLCACCGGLACLECIGCGLCAEGVDQF